MPVNAEGSLQRHQHMPCSAEVSEQEEANTKECSRISIHTDDDISDLEDEVESDSAPRVAWRDDENDEVPETPQRGSASTLPREGPLDAERND